MTYNMPGEVDPDASGGNSGLPEGESGGSAPGPGGGPNSGNNNSGGQPGENSGTGVDGNSPEGESEEDAATRERMANTYAWMPAGALDVYIEAYIKLGSYVEAYAEMRKDPRYEQWFPGNLTDDGRPRYSEELYANVIARYDSVMESVGLGTTFQHRYGEWIAGDVTPEEAQDRIVPMYRRIVLQSDQLKQWYATNYGIVLTDAALLASAIDPALGAEVLTGQISIAEIGGEGLESGFDIDLAFATRMFEEGSDMTRTKAESIFQRAESFIPVLSALSQRHADPDDDFDLYDFVAADLFADPDQRRRMNMLMAQERAMFTGGAQVELTRSQAGGLSGLEAV
jgi:hypothetical protein